MNNFEAHRSISVGVKSPIKMAIKKLFVTFTFGLLLIVCDIDGIAGYGKYYARVKDKSQRTSFAGTLISANFLVTAAVNVVHTSLYNPTSLVVFAGVTSNTRKAALQFRNATGVYVSSPDLYSDHEKKRDFAGIFVDPPFIINAFVQVIAAPCSYNPHLTGVITSIVRDDINPFTDVEEVQLKVVSDGKCKRYYRGTAKTTKCAQELYGFDNAFKKADIGAPVVQGGILIGLVTDVAYENDLKYQYCPILLTSFEKICKALSGPPESGPRSRHYSENILFLRIKSQMLEKYLKPILSQAVSAT